MIYKILLWYCIVAAITIIAATIWKTIEEGVGIEKEDIEQILTIGLLWFIIIPACILIYLPHKIIMYLRGDKKEEETNNLFISKEDGNMDMHTLARNYRKETDEEEEK